MSNSEENEPKTTEPQPEQPQDDKKTVEEQPENKGDDEDESEIITEKPQTTEPTTVKSDDEDDEKATPEDFMKMVFQLRQKGNDLFRGENYEAAILKYLECVRIIDAVVGHINELGVTKFEEQFIEDVIAQRVTTFTNLGVTYKKLGAIQKAFHFINRALKDDEYNQKALFNRAKIYFEVKYYDEAKGDIDELLELNPTNKEALSLRDEIEKCLKKSKDNDLLEAQRYLQRMNQMNQMMGMFGGMGMGGMGMRSREDMEKEELEKALELSRQEFAKEEQKRKHEEEEKKKIDDQQEEMRKYFESLKVEEKIEEKPAVEAEEAEDEDDDDEFVLDDDDEDDDDEDDDEDIEPVDNQSDDDE